MYANALVVKSLVLEINENDAISCKKMSVFVFLFISFGIFVLAHYSPLETIQFTFILIPPPSYEYWKWILNREFQQF